MGPEELRRQAAELEVRSSSYRDLAQALRRAAEPLSAALMAAQRDHGPDAWDSATARYRRLELDRRSHDLRRAEDEIDDCARAVDQQAASMLDRAHELRRAASLVDS